MSDKVTETFKEALDPTIHGGVMQTIIAMKEAKTDLAIAFTTEQVVNFLKTNFNL